MISLRLLTSASLLAAGVVAATSAPTVASATTVQDCAPAHLKVTLGQSQGTAGTILYPIVFTNEGTAACAIWGVPAVQPVVGGVHHSRVAVGLMAHNDSIAEMPVRHVISHLRSVSSAFGVVESGNYTASACLARFAGAIEVSMGRFLTSTLLNVRISVCTKIASTHTQLIVSGTTGS